MNTEINPEKVEQPVGRSALAAEVKKHILWAVADVRFGSVEIVIHEGRVVQIERREKVRFPQ